MGPVNAGHSAPVDESDGFEVVQPTEIEEPNSEEEPGNKKDGDRVDTGSGGGADGSESGKSKSIEGHGEKGDW